MTVTKQGSEMAANSFSNKNVAKLLLLLIHLVVSVFSGTNWEDLTYPVIIFKSLQIREAFRTV